MASASLSAEARTETGKGVARKLRSAGRVPAIVYGHAREPQALSLQTRELEKLLSSIATGSTVVELTFGGATTKTLIREVQRHPFKKQILHVDFQELVAGEKVTVEIPLVFVGTPEGVRLSGALLEQILHVDFQELVAGEKVTVEIPLVFVGTPEGVRLSGALLEQILHSIEVLVDPANIPNHIDVDVTNLAMGHSLHVRELVLPAGLEVLSDEDATVCAVVAPRAVVEETPAEGAEAAPAEPELIRKPKEEEEAK